MPAGTLVVFHYFALHQRKDLWGPDAGEFRPERWQNEKTSWVILIQCFTLNNECLYVLTKLQKFLPFGGGPRNCIGRESLPIINVSGSAHHNFAFVVEQFALTETSYTTVRLVQTFSAVMSRDTEPWTESLGATCSSANGVKVAMTPC